MNRLDNLKTIIKEDKEFLEYQQHLEARKDAQAKSQSRSSFSK
jgi:hypothetical protein